MFGKLKKKLGIPVCSAVVVAAGSAARMGGVDKVLIEVGGVPVVVRAIRALSASSLVSEVVVVTRPDLIVPISHLCKNHGLEKVTQVVVGGKTRAESVLCGLRALDPKSELAAIHDAARPFVTELVINDAIRAGARTGAAAPAIPVTDTVKIAVDGVVERTPDRDTLFAVQTPQVFETSLIKAALTQALETGLPLTDDCSAVEALGMAVHLTPGDPRNIKITTPADLDLAAGILAGGGEEP